MTSKKTILLLCTAFLSFAFLVGVYAYVFAHVKAKNENISSISNEIYFSERNEQEEGAVRRLVRTLNDERVLLDRAFVSSQEVPQFLESLESLGSAINISVVTRSVVVEEKRGVLVVELGATGTFSSMFRFLELLESTPYHLVVDRVGFVKSTLSDEERQRLGSSPAPWEAVLRVELVSFSL